MHLPGSQFALIAFDTDRSFDREAVERLERVLQISERWSLGSGIKVRLATIAEGPRSSVGIASLVNIPGDHSVDHITLRVDGALKQVGRDIVNGVWVRNIAVVSSEASVKPLAEAAAALRTLIEQVRDPVDRFGKILRIFLPSQAGAEPSTDDWRFAADRLRVQLRQHAAELSRDTAKPTVDYVESTADTGSLEARLVEALGQLSAAGMPPPVVALAGEVTALHKDLIRQTGEVVRVHQRLMPRLEELLRMAKPRAPAPVLDRLNRYLEQVLKPMADLERLFR